MKLKKLAEPVAIQVQINDSSYSPYRINCMKESYRPFPESSFNAVAHGLWYPEGREEPSFVAFSYKGKTLVAEVSCVRDEDVAAMAEKACGGFVASLSAASDYGLNDLVTELHLLENDFDVSVHSALVTNCSVNAVVDLKWELNGHVKPVAGFKRFLVIDENQNFIML